MSSSTDQSPRLRVRTQSTGLYLFRHRNYSPSLGTWTSQDPAGYINGANTYQFVMSNPVGRVDAKGLWSNGTWFGSIVSGVITGGIAAGFTTGPEGIVPGACIGGIVGGVGYPVEQGAGWLWNHI
jgi:RHS repeat-associated protein